MRRPAEPAAVDSPAPLVPAPRLPPTEATRRWAALLQEIFEVDPLVCPPCAGSMRIVACITQSTLDRRIHRSWRTSTTDRRHRAPPRSLRFLNVAPPHPGSLVGAARGARSSGIEPPPAADGPKRSRPDDPQRTQPGERPHPDHTRARGTA